MRNPGTVLLTRTAQSLYNFDRDTDNPHSPAMPEWGQADTLVRVAYRLRALAVLRDIGPYIDERKQPAKKKCCNRGLWYHEETCRHWGETL